MEKRPASNLEQAGSNVVIGCPSLLHQQIVGLEAGKPDRVQVKVEVAVAVVITVGTRPRTQENTT